MTNNIKILAISGSLRTGSSNNLLLKYIATLIPAPVNFQIYDELATIPAFDDSAPAPLAVDRFRELLAGCDAVLICSPEYAFGIPGALKNAIDWTVSSGELTGKPVALVTAATNGDKAHKAWLLIFKALSSVIPEQGALLIPYVRTKINNTGEVTDPSTYESLVKTLQALIQTAEEYAANKQLSGEH